MNRAHSTLVALAAALMSAQALAEGPSTAVPGPPAAAAVAPTAPAEATPPSRAEKRYEEMLNKMQSAVQEIAELYGSPAFLQVFTNDPERAAQLKERLRGARSDDDLRRESADLEKKRDALLDDVALRQRESSRLTARLVRERAALDALAAAIDQARRAVEETAKTPASP